MAIAFMPTHEITNQELEALSRANPGMRFERSSRGQLIVSPVGTIGSSGEIEVAVQLALWADQDGRGFATAPDGGFTLPDGSVFAPDGAWISNERWDALSEKEREGYAHIAPDVAFELLSPSDTLQEARTKASIHLANGTQLVVLLDPSSETVECHRAGGRQTIHVSGQPIALDPELPGLLLDADKIFTRMKKRR